ncbi:uncharacterized protein LY89DRAFT_152730 [Mollisia scopiformis]|uniref:Uncharacterized protein n=1 Tax=Mollisia scopiformis TaxID=149040 RepID=A0A194X2L9_MOLSC|nr:uncharacterized protein LY89DRAFT_152730 [Mollisia scopiformis]KUJ14087.1 hypothetical protein LY89DRAFT_152730 [Mollisia scopiformis]
MWRVQNPAWKLLLRSLLERIEDALKLKANGRGITVRRTCLILYGAGSTIQQTTSASCDTSLRFGTLDIALPSKHDDVSFEFSHDGKSRIISTNGLSRYDCSATAWFSDVHMTSSPITAGHRFVLRYSLEHVTPGPVHFLLTADQSMACLRPILTSWLKQLPKVTHPVLGHILEESFDDDDLRDGIELEG